MVWTTASQLKPNAQRDAARAGVSQEQKFPHNRVLQMVPQCENLARINVWIPLPGKKLSAENHELNAEQLVWQDPRGKWLKLIERHCSDTKSCFVLLAGDGDRPWRLLCSKADVRSYYKTICKVHKEQPLAQAPDVKRDCCMGTNVDKHDIAAAVLQQLADLMVKSSWEMCPQRSEGSYLLAKRMEHQNEEQPGAIVHRLAQLEAWFASKAVHIGIQLKQHEGKLFNVLGLLEGSLKKEWSQVLALSPDPSGVTVANQNKALCRTPCQLDTSSAPSDAQQHCCTVNFNADGSLWACVPASCLMTGCTTGACSPDTETDICKDLAQQLESVTSWASSKKNLVQVSDGEVKQGGASQAACDRRERHMPATLSTNLQKYLSESKPHATETTQQAKNKPRKPPTPGIAWLKQKEVASKPPNSKSLPKTAKRPGTTQPTTGANKVAKTAPAAKLTAPKVKKAAAQAKLAPMSAANVLSAAQKAGGGPAIAGTAGAPSSDAMKAAAKPADQAPKRERKKAADVNTEEAVAKVKAAVAAGTMAKLNLLELKAYLKTIGAPVGGKKADLIARIQAAAAAQP